MEKVRFFGGELLFGRRKSKRPLHMQEALHLVLKSKWAKGKHSFLAKQNEVKISSILKKQARRFRIKIYKIANSGDHLHLLIRARSRRKYCGFVRSIAGDIAKYMRQNPEIRNKVKKTNFWNWRPFTRIVAWGRDFIGNCQYLEQNTLEALGFIPIKPRNTSYAKFLRKVLPWGDGRGRNKGKGDSEAHFS